MKKLITVFIFLLLISCKSDKNEVKVIQNLGEAFGTTYNIQYESKTDYHEQLKEVFDAVNQSMSTYMPNSAISRINKGDTTVVIDANFIEVFNASKEIWQATEGYFDPTVGPLVNAYGFGPQGKMNGIDSIKIDSIKNFVGFEKLTLNSNNRLTKKHPNIFIDFNAIAKGYAIDLLGEFLENKNIENFLIEVGGEILSKGGNPANKAPWIVGIDDPNQELERTLIRKIKLQDKAMASSGNYRKTRIDPLTNVTYVHTINPKTGWPKRSNVLSVSVLAENCMLADGYATAFMVMELEETQKFLETNPSLEVFIIYVDEKGSVNEWFTEGFETLFVK